MSRAFALMTIALLATGCGPPTSIDRENYQRFESMRPAAFAEARLIESWQGFTEWEENGTTRQCAIAVFDVSEDAVEVFERQLDEAVNQAGAQQQVLIGWRRTALVAAPDEANPDDPWSWRDPLIGIRTAQAFCGMPEQPFATFRSAVAALWSRGDAPALAYYDDYDGGVLGGRRKHLYFFGILDRPQRRLYLWFEVFPSSGG